jgi:co-chaperonin GroES (HSP10)
MITKVVPVPPKSQPDTLDDVESSPEVSMEKKKVPANMTKGIILKLGPDYANDKGPYFGQFEIGDVVIYPTYAGINFELFKDTKMLRRYEIVATEKGV